mgnify:CR=1 FL=1
MVPRYSRKEMLEIWSDISKYSIWLDIEIHALEGMEKVGIVPVGTAEIVRKNAKFDSRRIDEIEAEIINKLSLQNQDLRLFVSNKNEENYINKLQGKKAVGDVTDDTHISTACRGAFCGVFFENNERDIFINAINESGLKRIIWVSENDTNKNILELDNLIYLKHKDYKGVEEKILDLESQETVEYGLIDLDT